jgi:hypothetical protein
MMNFTESLASRCRFLGVLAVAYLVLFGAMLWLWLDRSGVDPSWIETTICLAPAILGIFLARTSTEDQKQYIARILACVGFLPILLLFWGTSLDPASDMPSRLAWPFAVGAALVHAAAFVGLIFWGGSYITAVPAAAGVAPASAGDLSARLVSLDRVGAPWDVASELNGTVLVSLRFASGGQRGHQVRLKLNPQRHAVQVREKLTASMARPANEQEASMRGPADSYFDPTRPSASHVSGTTLQTSMIDPQRLATLPLRLFGQGVELPDGYAAALDTDGMVTLLCAVVTRSGWRWQPVFFASSD